MPLSLILFGATGMIGSGTLREALADPDVASVLVVGRRPCGVSHAKLREKLLDDLAAVPADDPDLGGLDGCLWCLGVSSVGLDEAAYRRVTHDLTLAWAQALLARNAGMGFCYVSAQGADGAGMWARVRRGTEQALLALPFRQVGCVRQGGIQPGPGIRSRTALYNAFITLMGPLFPWALRRFPAYVTTSQRLGRAMLRVLKGQAPKAILESSDINVLGAA